MEYGKDLLAALAVILNCLPSAMLALSMGFSVLATAIGFAVGAFGLAASGQVAVFSFQPETLLLLSRLSEDRNERLRGPLRFAPPHSCFSWASPVFSDAL